jgi:hypothetical protein
MYGGAFLTEAHTMTPLFSDIESELQLAGLPFDQCDLIAFCECNRSLIRDYPEPAFWAREFLSVVRECEPAEVN